jgi:hypothetical protein
MTREGQGDFSIKSEEASRIMYKYDKTKEYDLILIQNIFNISINILFSVAFLHSG